MARRRNPAWTYDELILALDLYINIPPARSAKGRREVGETSRKLRGLPIHQERGDDETFRGTNSVYMKLQNFKTVDPGYAGVGMPAGAGPRERLVWERFAGDPVRLHELAEGIVATGQTLTDTDIAAAAEDEGQTGTVPEGRILLAAHKRRERRGAAQKKREVHAATGQLECEVCGFDFVTRYGELGNGFAECHHKQPLAEGERMTRMADLAIVCANCHRMLHRHAPLLTIEELRLLLN